MRTEPTRIILFDGVCNLCNRSVQFVIKRDKKRLFRYAALQSNVALEELQARNEPVPNIESVILIDGNKVFYRSDAALRITKYLGAAWPLMQVFYIIPRFIRDAIYNYIGKNRYRWFGKRESCMIPTPELRSLFLD
jgi:predicted DCC family thiol-disulfide oxidoreductase YuxK